MNYLGLNYLKVGYKAYFSKDVPFYNLYPAFQLNTVTKKMRDDQVDTSTLKRFSRVLQEAGIQEEVKTYQVLRTGLSRIVYSLNGSYILRVSGFQSSSGSFEREINNLQQVAQLPKVPALLSWGALPDGDGRPYLLLTKIPGETLLGLWSVLSPAMQVKLTDDLVAFLKRLHAIPGESYSIGHYIPTIKWWKGTWLEGHDKYMDFLMKEIRSVPLVLELERLVERANYYYSSHRKALEYQVGPRLLHNDLHFNNIIVNDNKFSGVIDWECAQSGEPDFDLVHLVAWASFPTDDAEETFNGVVTADEFRLFIPNFMRFYSEISSIPNLRERFTIYLIEHELHQLIWAGQETHKQAKLKGRLQYWLEEPPLL